VTHRQHPSQDRVRPVCVQGLIDVYPAVGPTPDDPTISIDLLGSNGRAVRAADTVAQEATAVGYSTPESNPGSERSTANRRTLAAQTTAGLPVSPSTFHRWCAQPFGVPVGISE
jgi:hypothetical protein